MRSALFISPHLDDAAFSIGGTLARLAADEWETHLCTIFTRSIAAPRGFALRCQTDKGLTPDVDYMALRRREDKEFARRAGASRVTHLSFEEAPHRGYESAAELFGAVRAEDGVWRDVAAALRGVVAKCDASLIFAPQGLGAHVDHLQTIRAVNEAFSDRVVLWYRDMPYAMREAHEQPAACALPHDSASTLHEAWCGIACTLETKLHGIEAYTTQLGFQFGGVACMRSTLKDFHAAEARRVCAPEAVERLLCFDASELADCASWLHIARA